MRYGKSTVNRSYSRKALAERIEWILANRDISARRLGRTAHISESAIGQFLRRSKLDPDVDVSLGTLAAIANAADVSFGWLVTGAGAPDELYPAAATPEVLAALALARADGVRDDILHDWYAQFEPRGMLRASEVLQEIQAYVARWQADRVKHKAEEATDVTLVDVVRRWPTRWSRRAFDYAEGDADPPRTWEGWVNAMKGWQRLAERETPADAARLRQAKNG
jgi:transcriptional regulator with XRE-family HTH domain